jgi:protein gp37
MSQTKIEWATKVWNPVTGCTKISPGCQNCYAERMAKRLAGRCGYPKENPFKVTIHPERLEEPLAWKKPQRIFVCSMGDLFHDDVPDEFIGEVFNTMVNAQWILGHRFLVLTKRPERMKRVIEEFGDIITEQRKPKKMPDGTTRHTMTFAFPLQNIWLGVTAENQEQADKRIPILLDTPAAVRFVSVEPMLGPVDLRVNGNDTLCRCSGCMDYAKENSDRWQAQRIDWVICGGESGPGARPCHPDWIRGVRDQCQGAGVPFFFKQWGEWYPDKKGLYKAPGMIFGNTYIHKIGKKAAGRLLDGRTWDEFPKGAGYVKSSD